MEKVEHFHSNAPLVEPLRIKIERGQRGAFGYEISLSGADEEIIIERLKAISKKLETEFCTAAKEAQG